MAGSLKIDNINGKVISSSPVATESQVIGVGQTWQDVTASRSAGVTYTNNTGKPIYVSVYTEGDLAGGNDAVLTIDGKVIAKNSTADASGTDESLVQGIVPNGSTYSYTRILGTTYSFFELR